MQASATTKKLQEAASRKEAVCNQVRLDDIARKAVKSSKGHCLVTMVGIPEGYYGWVADANGLIRERVDSGTQPIYSGCTVRLMPKNIYGIFRIAPGLESIEDCRKVKPISIPEGFVGVLLTSEGLFREKTSISWRPCDTGR